MYFPNYNAYISIAEVSVELLMIVKVIVIDEERLCIFMGPVKETNDA